ncbi:reverse transcriptase domain-containing protein [Tanacetum coccineum]
MPFGLKNASATYKRLVDKAFDSQVGRNIEVYIDDLVIKSYTEAEMLRDIEETFRTLRKINMKLNPKKYTFGAVEGMFLGHKITPEEIKPCPNKIEALLQLPSPRTIKEVHSLNGKLTSLNRFLSKSVEKSLPLFKTLKKCINKSDFHWTSKVEQAFKQLKQHLSELPLLVAPKLKEELIVYLSASYGAVNGSGAGLILTSPKGTKFTYALRFQFTTSKNEAEYEALIAGLRIAAQMGVRNVQVSVDSKLVANQVLGTYVAKEENMIKYLEKVKSLVSGFGNFSISQVPRGKNKIADALSKIASTSFAHLSKQVLVEVLKEESIQEKEATTVVEEDRPTWMTPITEYRNNGTLPNDKKEAQKLRIKARQYESLEGVLYRRSFLKPWLRCVGPLQANYVIREIHKGSCMKHPQSNGLVERANRSLGEEIKACLGEGNKNWVEELPHVLWAHRTMIKSSHGDTPFSLTYGTEAVIPAEIRMPTYRTTAADTIHNDEELWLNLDLLEEKREHAAIREAKAMRMTKYYNARIRGVAFRPRNFVYRSNDASHAVPGGKLGPKLKGPYEVTEEQGDGAYKLRTMEGTNLPRTWNIANLKKCYL